VVRAPMSGGASIDIAPQLYQLSAATEAFSRALRQPPPQETERFTTQVVEDTARSVASLKDGTTTAFGFHSAYFGPCHEEAKRRAACTALEGPLLCLLQETPDHHAEYVVREVLTGLAGWTPLVAEGRLPAPLLAKAVEMYMHAPLRRWLDAGTQAQSVALDVEGLLTHKKAVQEAAERALEAATTRTERQSAKAAHFEQQERFYTAALAVLENDIAGDRIIIDAFPEEGVPEVDAADAEVRALVQEVAAARAHIAGKGRGLGQSPHHLREAEARLREALGANTTRLHASLAETIRLMEEHTALQTELTGVQVDQAIHNEVEVRTEAARQELLAAVDAEAIRLVAIQEAVAPFRGDSEAMALKIQAISHPQRQQAQSRVAANTLLFAQLHAEYRAHLRKLQAGKVRCFKDLQVELERLKKEQGQWEEFEHEFMGAQQLEKLDDRLAQLKEFQKQLLNDLGDLATKMEDLKSCGRGILSLVSAPLTEGETGDCSGADLDVKSIDSAFSDRFTDGF